MTSDQLSLTNLAFYSSLVFAIYVDFLILKTLKLK